MGNGKKVEKGKTKKESNWNGQEMRDEVRKEVGGAMEEIEEAG